MKEVNGKTYPLWGQFVDRKAEWIGGILQDLDLPLDEEMMTKIIDITLEPNGKDSAFFSVEGEEFTCGFDVRHGGIGGDQEEGWLTFSGYGGHKWRIKENKKNDENITC